MIRNLFAIAICHVFLYPVDASGTIFPSELKTEWSVNPLGVDVLAPGLSWILTSSLRDQRQAAYQIIVASSESILKSGSGDVWNSGRVVSEVQSNVLYQGPPLKSSTRYYWKVRVWDANDAVSYWSSPAWWEMGLLKKDDWQGKWISTSPERSAPLFRKEFDLSKSVSRATAHVFGLGWYEIHLNGAKVGNQVLSPANTDYSKIDLYDSYDVTQYLKKGRNAVGLWLADGYGTKYSKYGWRWLLPKLVILQLNIEYSDGSSMSLVTDETWKTADSQILSADIYNGETYDARLEKTGWDVNGYNDQAWEGVTVTAPPAGAMRSNMSVPLRVAKTITPVSVKQVSPGTYVFDMRQNIAGWVRIHVRNAHPGTRITMRHAEDINSDGTLNTFTNRSAEATDIYFCKGGAGIETYEPRFTYHGFRYVEIKGYPGVPVLTDVEGRAIHADVGLTGSFSCSDTLLNKIHSNFQWTMLNNMVSIVTDNPVRDERTPCQMDENCIYEAAIQNFDVQQYFKNWLTDIYGSTSNPDWSAGQVLGPWLLYQYYGDRRILKAFYPSSKKEVDYCIATAESSKYWADSFGDWCPPFTNGTYEKSYSEGEIVNTTLFYHITDLLSHIAGILGNNSDSAYYSNAAKSISISFNDRLFNASASQYGSGKQITSVMPLLTGLVPAEREKSVFEGLVKNVSEICSQHFGTGIYGTSFLSDILCDHGKTDLAYSVLSQTSYPAFGDQIINHGATTVWEQWGPVRTEREMETYDHAMYSGADKTFYTRFAGIRPLTPGYKSICIKPHIPQGLKYVKSSIKTVAGYISSEWEKSGSSYTHSVKIPVNTTAIIYIPGNNPDNIYEGGLPAKKSKGVRYLKAEDNYLLFEVGSGNYSFSCDRTNE